MTKKLLALSVSVIIVMSLFCVLPVSAEVTLPDNLGTDYEAGEVTGNKYDVANEAIGTTLVSNSTRVGFSANLNGDMVFSSNQVIGDGVEAINAIQAVGAQVATAYVDWTDLHVNGKTFIVGAQVKKLEGSPRITAGFTETAPTSDPNRIGDRANGYEVYEGFEITSTEYAPVCLTMTMTKARSNMDWSSFNIGFPEDPAGTTSVEPRSFAMKPGSLFIGFEAAHDIKVTSNSTTLFTGSTITVDADILNQVGVTGNLSQNVTWYALNDDRDTAVGGFSIVPGVDGKARVSVDSSVPTGVYTLVAVSNENDEFVKGIKVEVKNIDLTTDYEAGEVTGNKYDVANEAIGTTLLSNSTRVGFSANLNGDMVFSSDQVIGDGVEAINAIQAVGAQVATAYVDWTDLHVNGKTFIVGAQVKKLEGSPRITAGFTETAPTSDPNRIGDRANGYEVYEGFEITSTEYAPVCLTMTMTKARSNMDWSSFNIGFPEDPAGTTSVEPRSFAMKPGSLFIGFEAAHDINVSDDQIATAGDVITIDAEILNQVGTTGNLSQNVTWVPMNESRTEVVDGFTVIDNEDGLATVSVDSTVETGTYKLVAVADEDNRLIKAITVEIEGTEPVIEELTMTVTNGKISITTPDVLDAKLIVATYVTTSKGKKRMVDSDIIDVDLGAGQTQEYLFDVEEGTMTRAMLWTDVEEKCAPLIDKLEW